MNILYDIEGALNSQIQVFYMIYCPIQTFIKVYMIINMIYEAARGMRVPKSGQFPET